MRRLDSLLLTGVGVLLVHQSAYTVSSLAGFKAAVTHGHLEAAWLIGSLTAIGALAQAITRSLRRRRYELAGTWVLTAWILAGYLGLESIERIANGLAATSLVGEPVFWAGLVVAPIVATMLRCSMRTVVRMVLEVVDRRARVDHPTDIGESLAATSIEIVDPIFVSFTLSRRGPPRLSSS